MTQTPARLFGAIVVALFAGVVRGAELPIISKARTFLGGDAALDAVKTIHYWGTVTTSDPSDPKKQTRAVIEIVLLKPDHQRVTITSDKTIEVTALDSYDGWTRIAAASDPTQWQQTLLGADSIKRLRANTWENVFFFRGLEREGGVVEDQGKVTMDGIECEKVAFVHAPNIVFYRYFDRATGRVVFSETENGGTIKEEGEIRVDGVRFPQTIATTSKRPSGQIQTVIISFDKITLNEKLPPNFFAIPSLMNR